MKLFTLLDLVLIVALVVVALWPVHHSVTCPRCGYEWRQR
jgi:hypothetical protein